MCRTPAIETALGAPEKGASDPFLRAAPFGPTTTDKSPTSSRYRVVPRVRAVALNVVTVPSDWVRVIENVPTVSCMEPSAPLPAAARAFWITATACGSRGSDDVDCWELRQREEERIKRNEKTGRATRMRPPDRGSTERIEQRRGPG